MHHHAQPLGDVPLSSSVVDLVASASDLRGTAPPKKSTVNNDARRDDLWYALEARRLKHLGIAKHMAGLDEGLGLFTGDEEVVFA